MKDSSISINRFDTGAFLKVNMLPVVAFICSVLFWAFIFPVPDINDFNGLSRICLLMELKGWQHCVNVNWGFAHPLLNFLITKLTGDLLISQRILSAVFGLTSLLLAERIMSRIFNIDKAGVKILFLVWMALSPWMFEAVISVHLDIAATVFVLAGILLIKTDRPEWHLIAGLLVSISTWFRFHYISFAILYPLLVAVYYWSDRKVIRAVWALIGVSIGLIVPAILCYSVFGVFSISNAKAIIATNAPDFSWTIEGFEEIEKWSLIDFIRKIPLKPVFARFIWFYSRPANLILLIIMVLHLFSNYLYLRSRRKETQSSNWIRTFSEIGQKPSAILILYLIISISPVFLTIGLSFRHTIALYVIAFPLLCFIFSGDKIRYQVVLIFALLLVSMQMDYNSISTKFKRTTFRNIIAKQILSVVPVPVLKERPQKVLCPGYFYNPHHRYRLCSPIIKGGWMALSNPMVQTFGVIDIYTMHEDKDRLYELFEYIIFERKSRETENWNAYLDYLKKVEVMASLDGQIHETETFLIVELDRPVSEKGLTD